MSTLTVAPSSNGTKTRPGRILGKVVPLLGPSIPAHPDGPYERGAVIQWLRDVDRALDSWDPISIASLISVAASYLAPARRSLRRRRR